ncbi:MAG: SbmA/BacA-like family transporter [Alphaproteobacteria bacterium]
MDHHKKSVLRRAFDTALLPITAPLNFISKHIGYESARTGWENDAPMGESPKLKQLKAVFNKHKVNGPLMILSPILWSDLAVDVARVYRPTKDSPLIPKYQHSDYLTDALKFKPDPDLKARLEASTSMDTNRSFMGSFFKVIGMYWTKAGAKEVAIATGLAAATLYGSKVSVDVLAEFSHWSREFNDFFVGMGNTSQAVKTTLIDSLKIAFDIESYATNIELLQSVVSNNAYDLTNIDFNSAISSVRARPDMLESLKNVVESTFGSLSLDTFSDPNNIEQLNIILNDIGFHPEHQTAILESVGSFVQVKSSAVEIIEKIQNEFRDVNFETLDEAAIEDVNQRLDYLMATNVINAPAVDRNITHLFTRVPLEFSSMVGRYLLYLLPSIYAASHLALRWQVWTQGKLSNEWNKYNAAYNIKFKHTNLDNPDQRIEQNMADITSFVVDTTTDGMQNVLKLAAFLPILSTMGSFNPAWVGGPDIQINNFMTWTALGYAAVVTGIIGAIAYKLPSIRREMQRTTANLRGTLRSIHSQPEQIALTEGSDIERTLLKVKQKPMIDAEVRNINVTTAIRGANGFINNAAGFIPLFLTAPMYASGIMTFGQTSQAASIFRTVENSFEFFKRLIPSFASFKAGLDRQAQFIDAIELSKYEMLERDYHKRMRIEEAYRAQGITPEEARNKSALEILHPQMSGV